MLIKDFSKFIGTTKNLKDKKLTMKQICSPKNYSKNMVKNLYNSKIWTQKVHIPPKIYTTQNLIPQNLCK